MLRTVSALQTSEPLIKALKLFNMSAALSIADVQFSPGLAFVLLFGHEPQSPPFFFLFFTRRSSRSEECDFCSIDQYGQGEAYGAQSGAGR
jgi:hypothetical protein